MSRQQKDRLRLVSEIERYRIIIDIPCDRCIALNYIYIAIEDSARVKYSEYVRAGRLYINISWSSLNKTQENLFFKILEDK